MRRVITLLAAMLFTVGMVAGPAAAHEEVTEHGHALVLHLEFEDGEPVGFHRCVELANGEELRLRAHHESVHTGTAGEMLFTKAGHAVVPLQPFPESPFGGCEDIEAFLSGS